MKNCLRPLWCSQYTYTNMWKHCSANRKPLHPEHIPTGSWSNTARFFSVNCELDVKRQISLARVMDDTDSPSLYRQFWRLRGEWNNMLQLLHARTQTIKRNTKAFALLGAFDVYWGPLWAIADSQYKHVSPFQWRIMDAVSVEVRPGISMLSLRTKNSPVKLWIGCGTSLQTIEMEFHETSRWNAYPLLFCKALIKSFVMCMSHICLSHRISLM